MFHMAAVTNDHPLSVLKQLKYIISQYGGHKPKIGITRISSVSEAFRGECLPLPASGGSRYWFVAALLQSLFLCECVCVKSPSPLSYKNTCDGVIVSFTSLYQIPEIINI
jgi:hypothetical protein